MTSSFVFAIVSLKVKTYLTPLWLLGIGALIGLVALLVLWALLFIVFRRLAKEIGAIISEGIMPFVLTMILIMSVFGLVTSFVVDDPFEILKSTVRLHTGTEKVFRETIPPSSEDERRRIIPVNFRGEELVSFEVTTNQFILFCDGENDEVAYRPAFEIDPVEGFEFRRTKTGGRPFAGRAVPNFYIANLGNNPADVEIKLQTAPEFPETSVVIYSALGVFGFIFLYVLQVVFSPKTAAVALSTVKSELAQPFIYILAIVGAFLLILSMYIPYNTFGEDIKMLKDSGLTLIMLIGIVLGVWAASNSVADEIEGRTALTVLSKPLSRLQFLLGKFSGIMWIVSLMFIWLGLVFVFVVGYKPLYDAREMASQLTDWRIVHFEIYRIVPGLVLAFFETAVMAAISIAVSTRLSLLANFVICLAVYALGHLTPLIVQAKVDFAPVVFIGNLIATVLPVLDHFNIQAAVAAGVAVPISYLGVALLYALLYSSIALLLALILFEDRDLA